ncbi:MAG: hypothetical protein ACJ73E_15095 [Mycobacteriales bacterium]
MQVGIDAAVVANHSVCVRQVDADGVVSAIRFQVPPTLAGLGRLGRRLADCVGLTPSSWSSGTVSQPHRAISKEVQTRSSRCAPIRHQNRGRAIRDLRRQGRAANVRRP